MNAFITSLVRTVVPLAVGWLAAWLAAHGVAVSADAAASLEAGIVVSAAFAYYAGVRALESKWPWVGVLLGVASAPVYTGPGVTRDELEDALATVRAAIPDGDGRHRA